MYLLNRILLLLSLLTSTGGVRDVAAPTPEFSPYDYDSNPYLYSPDGTLPQVDYAEKAVTSSSGALSVRKTLSDGRAPLIVVASRSPPTRVRLSSLCPSLLAAPLGFIPDAEQLLSTVARPALRSILHSYSPNISPASTEHGTSLHSLPPSGPLMTQRVAEAVADSQAQRCLGGGIRTAAASIVLCGVERDEGAKVFVTTPRGNCAEVCRDGAGFDMGGEKGGGEDVEGSWGLKAAVESAVEAVLPKEEKVEGEVENVEISIVSEVGTLKLNEVEVKELVDRVREERAKAAAAVA